jgi:hypothetical protein
MKARLTLPQTTDSIRPRIAGLALGLGRFPHRAQKPLGWRGGHGFTGNRAS